MSYLAHLSVLCAVFVAVAWSLDVLLGRLRIFSLCQAAFMSVGAYSYAVAQKRFGLTTGAAVAVALLLSLALGLTVGRAAGRFKSEQAMLFTIAIQGLATTLLFNVGITGGPFGIGDILPPNIFKIDSALLLHLAMAGALCVSALAFFTALRRSAAGMAMAAVGEDELLAQTLGIDPGRIRLAAFGVAAGVAGLAGVVLAGYLTFIDPTSFGLNESVLLVTALLVGGTGTLAGPALGIVVVLMIPEVLRAVDVASAAAGNIQAAVFGATLLVLMRLRPRGLAGEVIQL